LQHGIDVTCINCRKQTALDVISRMPASRSNVTLRQLLQSMCTSFCYSLHLISCGGRFYMVMSLTT